MQPWQNITAPLATRVANLLSLLTQAELLDQLGGPDIGAINRPDLVLPGYSFGIECLAGVAQGKVSTAFPLPVNLGSSFDTSLVEEVASAIGDEARALYNIGETSSMHCLGPVLNLARDPRWGRSYESYGEDPFLIARLGEAYVHGMTTGPGAANVTSAEGFSKVGAVAKHAAAYNFEGCVGHENYPNCSQYRSSYNARVNTLDMHESYLTPWRVVCSKLEGVMCSYNSIDGVPACANAELLENTLRGSYGLQGIVIADDGAISKIHTMPPDGGHNFAPTDAEAALIALTAGVDVAYGPGYANYVPSLNLTRSALEPLVSRSLAARFRLGAFDPPASNPWSVLGPSTINSAANRALARRAALQSFVLLHNTHEPAGLPLHGEDSILMLGSAANDSAVLRGNYNGNPSKIINMLQGISLRAHAAVSYFPGRSATGLAKAAANVSVVVAVVRSEDESESHDRANITVREADAELLRVLCSLSSKPRVVLVLVNGGAIDVSEWMDSERCHNPVVAIVETWLGGEEAGSALASLLFGDENFAALSPVTVYRQTFVTAADVADAGLRSPVGRGYRYVDADKYVLFPFGFGLSYTRWTAGPVVLEPSSVSAVWLAAQPQGSTPIRLRTTLVNAGPVAGSRPVLLYLRRILEPADPRARGASMDWPKKWLVAFTKVHAIAPNSSAPVELAIGADAVSRWVEFGGSGWAAPGQMEVIPGRYAVVLSEGEEISSPCVLTVNP
jgi:beta-glucosidase-like glycosyl hydrolase